jgi:hypothetical protein
VIHFKSLALVHVAALSLGCVSSSSSSSQEPTPHQSRPAAETATRTSDPILENNLAFRAVYSEARSRVLSREGPVILAMGNDLIFVSGSTHERVPTIPESFHDLKSVAHLPLAIYVILDDTDGDLLPATEDQLTRELKLARAMRATVLDGRFTAAQEDRQTEIIDRCTKFVEQVLSTQVARYSDTLQFTDSLSALVLANVADAAQVQIDAYDEVIGEWRGTVSPEDWSKTKAIVSGAQLPRAGALPVQYFASLFGVSGEGPRVIYAESIWDLDQALRLLGTHVLDRRISQAFFDDDDRMHRDILSDSAARILMGR